LRQRKSEATNRVLRAMPEPVTSRRNPLSLVVANRRRLVCSDVPVRLLCRHCERRFRAARRRLTYLNIISRILESFCYIISKGRWQCVYPARSPR
jgi:hypothetical protein